MKCLKSYAGVSKNTGVINENPKIAEKFFAYAKGDRMKIADEKSDAIQLIRDLKKEMAVIREMIAELEYVVYECDERVEIVLFERGANGSKEKSKE